MPRLLLLTAGELTRDPRARRAADAAHDRGLTVAGVCRAGAPPVDLPGVEIVRLPGADSQTALRPARRSAPVRELRGLGRLARLARLNIGLARSARGLAPFDVVHANDFETLPAGAWLARRGARLVYDAHELSTRQEVDPPRLYVVLARFVEGLLARRADVVITVGDGIARELAADLRLAQIPTVVLNCPPVTPSVAAAPSVEPLRAIYQGAMGPGRDVADLIAAARATTGVELTIRVQGANIDELRELVTASGLDDRVRVAEPVPPDRLDEGLAGHHVGLIINRPVTRNDELVLPNKLFEYLMAGLAVVMPGLPELLRVAEEDGVGLAVPPGDPTALGAALTTLARDRGQLAAAQDRARTAAVERYNASTQAELLAVAWGIA